MQVTKPQLADLFGVTVRTLTTWQHDADFPLPIKSGKRNTYDAAAVIAWWHNREIAKLIESDDGKMLDLNHERALLARSQRHHLELRIAADEGRLIPADEVREQWASMVTIMRSTLLALPTRMAPVVAAGGSVRECAEAMRKIIYEALDALAANASDDDGRC